MFWSSVSYFHVCFDCSPHIFNYVWNWLFKSISLQIHDYDIRWPQRILIIDTICLFSILQSITVAVTTQYKNVCKFKLCTIFSVLNSGIHKNTFDLHSTWGQIWPFVALVLYVWSISCWERPLLVKPITHSCRNNSAMYEYSPVEC